MAAAAIADVLVEDHVASPLDGVRVCVLSTIPISTSRIVNRQCHALVRFGCTVTLISPNTNESSDGRFARRHFKC